MKEFPLGNGLVALVDDEDWEMLIQHRWYAKRSKRKTVDHAWYAVTNLVLPDGCSTQVSMHQLIMNTPAGMEVDHKDHNGLNNQKANLRVCTPGENRRNRRLRDSKYPRGVFLVKGGKYGAQLSVNGKKFYNGLNHQTIDGAAQAYNELAIKHHGAFAFLNKIGESAMTDK
jgi:hypothetical protein